MARAKPGYSLSVVRSGRLELSKASYRVTGTEIGNMVARGIDLNTTFRNL